MLSRMQKCPVLISMTLVVAFVVLLLRGVQSNVLKSDTNLNPDNLENGKQRKLDNFVDFTGDGDQLAVESLGSSTTDGSGAQITLPTGTGRQCANVQTAVYPVIPVIIAALVGLIGAVIISAIVRLIFRIKNDSDKDGGNSSSGYDRRAGGTFFGLDFGNINFATLAKNVLTAIEKHY